MSAPVIAHAGSRVNINTFPSKLRRGSRRPFHFRFRASSSHRFMVTRHAPKTSIRHESSQSLVWARIPDCDFWFRHSHSRAQSELRLCPECHRAFVWALFFFHACATLYRTHHLYGMPSVFSYLNRAFFQVLIKSLSRDDDGSKFGRVKQQTKPSRGALFGLMIAYPYCNN
jgi:hypothetical protein